MLLALLVCLLLLAAILVHGQGKVASPAMLVIIAWSLLLLFALVFGSAYLYSPRATAAVGILLGCFLLGCLAAAAIRPGALGQGESAERWRPEIPRWLILLGAAIGALGAVLVSLSFGSSLLSVGSFRELLTTSQANAVGIFRGENSIPLSGKVCFAALQLACLLSGARFVLSASRRYVVELGALAVSSLLWSVITTQRSYILVPAIWWVSGLVAAYAYSGRLGRRLRPRSVVLAALTAFAFGGLVLAIRLVRTGDAVSGSGPGSEGLIASSRPWLAGYLPAFSSSYLKSVAEGAERSWAPLFTGFQALAGQGGDELSGGYEYIGQGDFSNAATVLRFFVGGGGLAGAAVALFVLGAACQLAYRRAREGSALAALGYACAAAGILWSPNSWFFGYGGRLLVIVMALLLLLVVGLRRLYPARTWLRQSKDSSA